MKGLSLMETTDDCILFTIHRPKVMEPPISKERIADADANACVRLLYLWRDNKLHSKISISVVLIAIICNKWQWFCNYFYDTQQINFKKTNLFLNKSIKYQRVRLKVFVYVFLCISTNFIPLCTLTLCRIFLSLFEFIFQHDERNSCFAVQTVFKYWLILKASE